MEFFIFHDWCRGLANRASLDDWEGVGSNPGWENQSLKLVFFNPVSV